MTEGFCCFLLSTPPVNFFFADESSRISDGRALQRFKLGTSAVVALPFRAPTARAHPEWSRDGGAGAGPPPRPVRVRLRAPRRRPRAGGARARARGPDRVGRAQDAQARDEGSPRANAPSRRVARRDVHVRDPDAPVAPVARRRRLRAVRDTIRVLSRPARVRALRTRAAGRRRGPRS